MSAIKIPPAIATGQTHKCLRLDTAQRAKEREGALKRARRADWRGEGGNMILGGDRKFRSADTLFALRLLIVSLLF